MKGWNEYSIVGGDGDLRHGFPAGPFTSRSQFSPVILASLKRSRGAKMPSWRIESRQFQRHDALIPLLVGIFLSLLSATFSVGVCPSDSQTLKPPPSDQICSAGYGRIVN